MTCNCTQVPGAGGDYDPWMLPDPKRDFVISSGFALQRANARMVRDAHFRRRKNRAGERYASQHLRTMHQDTLHFDLSCLYGMFVWF